MRGATDVEQCVVLLAFAASLMFVLLCTLAWKWWRTVWGRTSVAISGALSVALLPGVLNVLLGVNTQTPWFAWYRDASIAAVFGIEVWRTVAVLRAQWRRESAHVEPSPVLAGLVDPDRGPQAAGAQGQPEVRPVAGSSSADDDA